MTPNHLYVATLLIVSGCPIVEGNEGRYGEPLPQLRSAPDLILKESNAPYCVVTVNFEWRSKSQIATKEEIFLRTMIELGNKSNWSNKSFIDVDVMSSNQFGIFVPGTCLENYQELEHDIRHAFAFTDSAAVEEERANEMATTLTIDFANDSNDVAYFPDFEELTFPSNYYLLQNKYGINDCLVKINFVITEDEADAHISKTDSFTEAHLNRARYFFNFPIFFVSRDVFISNFLEEDSNHDYTYLLFRGKCEFRLELTQRLIQWSKVLVGADIDIPRHYLEVDGLEQDFLKSLGISVNFRNSKDSILD